MIKPPFARSLQVDLVPGVEVVKTDGFIVKGEELDAAVVHGEFERIWRLRRRSRQKKGNYSYSWLNGEAYFGLAYREVGGVASHVENNVTWTEVQEALAVISLPAALNGHGGRAGGDVFGEDHLGILIDSKYV